MALTEYQLYTLLKRNLHNDATLTSTDFATYLTLAQERIVQDSPSSLGVKEAVISVTQSTRVYSLASDFFQMRAMYCSTESRWIDPVPVKEFVETVERLGTIPDGTPLAYCVRGFDDSTGLWQVAFDHVPTTSYTYGYQYYWKPQAMTIVNQTTVPPVSAVGFGKLIVDAATMIATEANDPERFQIAAAAYELGMRQYRCFNPMGPDYTPQLRPGDGVYRGSTWRLPDTFPAD